MTATIYPSQNTWTTPRSTEYKITTDNCSIILSQRIEKIDKMLLNGNLKIHIQFKVGDSASETFKNLNEIYLDSSGEQKIENLDLTKWVVEKAKYDTLPLIARGLTNAEKISVIKNNTWYYEHNSKNITLCNESLGGIVFPTAVFSRIVEAGVLSLGKTYIQLQDGGFYEIISVDVPTTTTLMSAQFRVYYTPLGESVKLAVPKTNPQGVPFCIPYSQQQPIVDNVSHGREMQSIANRTNRSLINPSKESSVLQR